jgi:Domain of unknown function (DUF4145)
MTQGTTIRTIKENKTKDQMQSVECPECKRSTKHRVVSSFVEAWNNKKTALWGTKDYQIIECQGCETVSYRSVEIFSEDFNYDADGNLVLIETVNLYPDRTNASLTPKMLPEVPQKLRRIYREVIESFNIKLFTLCAAGLRAIIEGICLEKNIKKGPVVVNSETKTMKNLAGKISGLAVEGLLTKSHSNILHQHRFLGNEAVHELAKPTSDELSVAIEIVEHVFKSIYVIPVREMTLKKKTAARKKRAKTKK